MKSKKSKFFLLLFLLLIIFIGGKFVFNNINNVDIKNQPAQVINAIIEEEKPKKTTIFFVGDIMLTRGLKSSVDKNFDGDYGRLFENLSELKNADILFGNLEGDVSDVGNNVGSKYSFRMDPKIMIVLKNAGFDILSFANNHVGDWNMAAFKDTLERLDENEILKIGSGLTKEEIENPQIIEKNGTRFGFLGFSDVGPNWLEAKADNPGILLANDPRLPEIIKRAKIKCDVLIVSFHFGAEYKTIHNSRQEMLAHTAIDNGADMIIGHHPHVIEDVEIYKGKTIVYSLGNFIFDQYFSRDTMRGMLFSATFEGSELINTEEKIITLNKKFQPEGIFTKSEIREKDEVESGNCPNPTKEYFDMSLLNIGQLIKLPDTEYMPKNLRELNTESSTKSGICLIKEVRNAFEEMSMSAKKDGYIIKASSGFRSYDNQQNIFSNGLRSDKVNTIISIAKPGYSEHQLGTTVDITSSSINYDSASEIFEDTPEDNWLKEHAYLYGFNQSYQKGKEDITGYKYEPWHYRYVGIENAKKLKDGYTIPN
jgi:poly-gamma-glutamate synthesis protein (capsule biosynthesis protein)